LRPVAREGKLAALGYGPRAVWEFP